ncbi:hypothetical protein ACE4V3_05240 (plasmid) [Borrelia recurrentis]|uniref:Uncharacterized protein n=1 Tax=Borrelia recurrentis (strain A1) TaxID=412418 RepID=B5RRT4_BORRA|nr:hypothetical protein [Borrelia recurrentis]ACH95070.1 hypothetical protein BRE_1005 [Borrelia recurrentis A1]
MLVKWKYFICVVILVLSIVILKCPLGKIINNNDFLLNGDLDSFDNLNEKNRLNTLDAYSALQVSFVKLRDSYIYIPVGFDEAQFDSIFQWNSTIKRVKYGIYSVLKRDIGTLNNLNTIVTNLSSSFDKNLKSVVSDLFIGLWDIASSIDSVLARRGYILSDANLIMIKSSSNTEIINDIRVSLEHMLELREELVRLLQNIINSAAIFGINALDRIEENLRPIITLALGSTGLACSTNRICVINNELKSLSNQIEDNVSKLKKEK